MEHNFINEEGIKEMKKEKNESIIKHEILSREIEEIKTRLKSKKISIEERKNLKTQLNLKQNKILILIDKLEDIETVQKKLNIQNK